jgi:CheY-like chemotaxis protein
MSTAPISRAFKGVSAALAHFAIGLIAESLVGEVPVVAVSADATTARIELAFAQGVNEYVTKPLDIQTFLVLLDRPAEEQSTLFG